MTSLHDHDTRMAAARRWAQWHLGDPSWADNLINAYHNPDASDERLRRERSKYDDPPEAVALEDFVPPQEGR